MPRFEEIMNYYPGNRLAYRVLLKRIKEQSIVPFIGAGLSACCYPSWEKLILDLTTSVSDECAKLVIEQLSLYDYLSAADILCDEMGELLFYEAFRNAFDENLITTDKIENEAVSLIPKFRFKTLITTNYDRVLEKAFSLNNSPYEIGYPYDTYKLSSYMRDKISSPMILKIHGDIKSDNNNLILTGKSYGEHYHDGACLNDQLTMWAESKNFLFLGASLYKDKTVQLIADRMQEGMINYAIMGAAAKDIDTVKERISSVNALPIFYDNKDHSCLKVILQKLLDDSIDKK